MKSVKKVLLALLFIVQYTSSCRAGELYISAIGNLFVTNYSPSEYHGEKQNWDITIGDNGLIFFANGPLLEAGTKFWKRYYLPESNYIRSVYSLDSNAILVGGPDEIGYFRPGPIPGQMKYTSLMNKLDSSYRDFGTIWQIFPYRNALILRAGKALFRYENDTIVPILFGKIIDYSKVIHDTLYVRINDEGLGFIHNGNFELLPYGKRFSSIKIIDLELFKDSRLLVFTDDHGVFKIDHDVVKPFQQLNYTFLQESQIHTVKYLQQKYFAIGTVKDGLYLFDSSGKLIQHLNRSSGLQNNTILSMEADSLNNLWVGMDIGISYVELNSCISHLFSGQDIGTGYVSKYFDGKLYFGTNQGLYFSEWDSAAPGNKFSKKVYPVENTSGQVWYLFSTKDVLYCGHHKGLFRIDGNKGVLINPVEGCWQIDSVISHPRFFLESTYRGYYLLEISETGRLINNKLLSDVPYNARTFREDEHGYFWISTPEHRIFRFKIDVTRGAVPFQEDMTDVEGIPEFSKVKIAGNKRHVFISTDIGLFSYNYGNHSFESHAYYDQIIGKDNPCYEFFEDNYNRIWYVKNNEIGYFSLYFGNVQKVHLPFNKILNVYTKVFGSICVLNRNNVLFGVNQGFSLFTSNCNETLKENYHAYIINLSTYTKPVAWASSDHPPDTVPVYPHTKNSFEFMFSSDFFDSPENVYYQYQLVGFDDDWSEWTTRNSKEFSNLFEGTYKLLVRARNGFGNESNVASFSFRVRPPFYRSLLAYLFYLCVVVVFLIILWWMRQKRIEREKQKIEEKKQRELEQRKKSYEDEQMKARQKIAELENEKLQQDLLHKMKELSNSMINILHKNEIFLNLKTEMQKLYMEKNISKRDTDIRRLIHTIDNEISSKRDLEIFDTNFSAVHKDFIKKLRDQFPALNQNDIRLCTFIKTNKSTKEIASLMNMSVRGVETSRYRLRKKMMLNRDDNLYKIISGI